VTYGFPSKHDVSPAGVNERMSEYKKNLGTMVDMATSSGAVVVLGTVSSNLAGRLPEQFANVDFEAARAENPDELQAALDAVRAEWAARHRHQASDTENDIIRGVAEATGVAIADVELAVTLAEPGGVPGATLFHDWCHLNPEGRELLSEVFAEAIAQALEE
jgi:hypothetical protein